MIFVASITDAFAGRTSSMPGRTSLTSAPGWNRAPVIVAVTQRLSPPWSTVMSVTLNGSAFAVSVTAGSPLPDRRLIRT